MVWTGITLGQEQNESRRYSYMNATLVDGLRHSSAGATCQSSMKNTELLYGCKYDFFREESIISNSDSTASWMCPGKKSLSKNGKIKNPLFTAFGLL
jgi:hypothetical protein